MFALPGTSLNEVFREASRGCTLGRPSASAGGHIPQDPGKSGVPARQTHLLLTGCETEWNVSQKSQGEAQSLWECYPQKGASSPSPNSPGWAGGSGGCGRPAPGAAEGPAGCRTPWGTASEGGGLVRNPSLCPSPPAPHQGTGRGLRGYTFHRRLTPCKGVWGQTNGRYREMKGESSTTPAPAQPEGRLWDGNAGSPTSARPAGQRGQHYEEGRKGL